MRLLHTRTRKLQSLGESEDAKKAGTYAILSHTWLAEADEVSFEVIGHRRAKKKAGFRKLDYACKQALNDGFDYVWIDTCCIDKSNHAELSEAINSMFDLYRDAAVCYAYIDDNEDDLMNVSGSSDDGTNDKALEDRLPGHFRAAKWFSRGWTLQELIAPSKLIFFDQYWRPMGTKSENAAFLADVTYVDENVLRNRDLLHSICVGKRMSWVSRRQTTRIEDQAYFLLGISSVSMPLIYGEGQNAFLRLQAEIVKASTDHSIFAWLPPMVAAVEYRHKLLAPEPRCFEKSRNLFSLSDPTEDQSYELSNRGLRISLPVADVHGQVLASLNCLWSENGRPAILRMSQIASRQANKACVCVVDREPSDQLHDASEVFSEDPEELIILKESLPTSMIVRLLLDPAIEIVSSTPQVKASSLGPCFVVNATHARQFCEGSVTLKCSRWRAQPVLRFAQFLRQEQSEATFRMQWDSNDDECHQQSCCDLTLVVPAKQACCAMFLGRSMLASAKPGPSSAQTFSVLTGIMLTRFLEAHDYTRLEYCENLEATAKLVLANEIHSGESSSPKTSTAEGGGINAGSQLCWNVSVTTGNKYLSTTARGK